MDPKQPVVIDTNVFVGAGFRPGSASGAVVRAVREGSVRMRWTAANRRETEAVLRRIPPLSWSEVEGIFRAGDEWPGDPDEGGLDWVLDPADRKFAALARAAGAVLVSNDRDVLTHRAEAGVPVLTPREYVEREGADRLADTGPEA